MTITIDDLRNQYNQAVIDWEHALKTEAQLKASDGPVWKLADARKRKRAAEARAARWHMDIITAEENEARREQEHGVG